MPSLNPLNYLNALRTGPVGIQGVEPGNVPVPNVFSKVPKQSIRQQVDSSLANAINRARDLGSQARNVGTNAAGRARAAAGATSQAVRNGATAGANALRAVGDMPVRTAVGGLARATVPVGAALGLGSMYVDMANDEMAAARQRAVNAGRSHIANDEGVWVPTDDPAVFRNIETNALAPYNGLVGSNTVPAEDYRLDTSTSGSIPFSLPPEAYVETNEPAKQIELASSTPKEAKKTPKGTTPKNQGNGNPLAEPKAGASAGVDWMELFNQLLPLVAVGGLGYYMGRR